MYLAELAVFLSTCFSIEGIYSHHKHGLQYMLDELETAALFNSSDVQTLWIDQPLDHFDDKETRRWNMKYFQNLDMWKPNGSIYLFVNGEYKATAGFIKTGLTYELAQETNGALFSSEHRYYGDSKPFENITTDNVKFLSSRQALADNARLLLTIKSLPQYKSSKVVVVGGSYAGSLVAWMRLLYPNLVDAAIASSAPVLAKVDFFEYLETVSDDFEQFGSPGCLGKIAKIFSRYEELLKTDDGIKELKEEENICNDTNMYTPENQQIFFLHKAGFLGSVAQYGDLDRIKRVCNEIPNYRPLSKGYMMSIWREKQQCFDYDFENMIKYMREDELDFAWTYQTCTEFGYYVTTDSKNQSFTNNILLNFYYKVCQEIFGADFDKNRVEEGVHTTNEMYGGLHPNVTQVVFVNGALDPWHRLSVLEDLSSDAPAKVIPFSSHCRDLFPDKPSDPEELKEARKYIKSLVKKWIGVEEKCRIKINAI